MNRLSEKRCIPCEGGARPLSKAMIRKHLQQVPGWKFIKGEITRTFKFENYYQTIAFVNATAWISNQQNHHPDLEVGYNQCKVRFSTHAIGGISENDFICAAKIEALGA